MKSILDEDAVKTIEMTTKDLKYYINILNKAVAEFEKTDSNFERSCTVVKILSYQIASHTIEKSSVKGRVNQCSKLDCVLF